MNIQNLVLDINKKCNQIVTANVGEVGSRFLKINIIDNGMPVDLTGVTVYLYAKKADDTKVFNTVKVEDAKQGIVLVEITSQVLAIEGLIKLTLLLVKDNARLATKIFNLKVDETIIDDEAIESANEFGALTESLSKLGEWNSYFEETSGKIEEKYTERLNQVDSQLEHIKDDISKRVITPILKTSSEDPSYDNVKAINDAIEKIKMTGGVVNIPQGIYLIDSDLFENNVGVKLYSNLIIEGNGATLLLKNKNYLNNISIMRTYNMINGDYVEGIENVENIEIRNLKIDGNILNMNNDKSVTGIDIYKGKNIKLNNISIKNLSGKSGAGYGFVPWYCDNVEIKNAEIINVDRSPIYVWETSNFVMDSCHCENGYYRDAITISTNSPHSYQKTTFNIKNSKFINKNTTGTHVVRFSGTSEGLFENNIVEGDLNYDGICILDTYFKNINLKNNKIYNCTEGVKILSDTDKILVFENNLISSCNKGIYCVSSGGDVKFINNKIINSVARSVEIGYSNFVAFNNNYIEGGTDVMIGHFKQGIINNNIFKDINQDSNTYNLMITGTDGIVQFNFNIFYNAPGKVRVYQLGKAICNNVEIESSSLSESQFNG